MIEDTGSTGASYDPTVPGERQMAFPAEWYGDLIAAVESTEAPHYFPNVGIRLVYGYDVDSGNPLFLWSIDGIVDQTEGLALLGALELVKIRVIESMGKTGDAE